LEVAAAAQAGHHFDNVGGGGESSDSRSEVRALCSLLSHHMSFLFMLLCSSILFSFTTPADFGFFNLRDIPPLPFIFFLLPIVVGIRVMFWGKKASRRLYMSWRIQG
jgi:hypothetical protein